MTSTPQLLLNVNGLDTFYGRSQVLFGLTLSVARGESMALLGRNGAGKSTTMKSIMRILPARRGTVQAMGRDVERLRVEVNLFDFSGDLVGRKLRIRVRAALREERKFNGVAELTEQLHRDRDAARTALAIS